MIRPQSLPEWIADAPARERRRAVVTFWRRVRETISATAAWMLTLGRALAVMAEGAVVSAAVLLPLVAWAVAR